MTVPTRSIIDLALHEKWAYTLFSVQPLCALCLCGSLLLRRNNHRDTEHTEVAQRRSRIETFRAKPVRFFPVRCASLWLIRMTCRNCERVVTRTRTRCPACRTKLPAWYLIAA